MSGTRTAGIVLTIIGAVFLFLKAMMTWTVSSVVDVFLIFGVIFLLLGIILTAVGKPSEN